MQPPETRHPIPRRRIAAHPAFAPLCALWWALLLGGGIGIVPESWLPQWAANVEAHWLVAGTAVLGLILGLGVARLMGEKPEEMRSARTPQAAHSPEASSENGEHRVLDVVSLPAVEADEWCEDDPENDRFADLPHQLRSPLDSRPLEEMGSTELLERLAAAMHRYMAIRELERG